MIRGAGYELYPIPLFAYNLFKFGMLSMETVEVQMARLQEQMKSVLETLQRDSQSRARSHEKIEKIGDVVDGLDRRLENVEKQLATQSPTIEEFITIKHQVKGAGLFGKVIWSAGAFLIGITFSMREQIRDWFLN